MNVNRRIYVPTTGGFGNQLFTVAFAVRLSKLGHKTTLFSGVEKSQIKGHPTMFNVTKDLSNQLEGPKVAKGAFGALLRAVAKLLGAMSRLGLPASSLLQDMQGVSDLDINPKALFVRGYFQNPSVLKSAASEIRKIVDSYGSTEKPSLSDGIIIHYRRGDYLQHGHSFGILADDFFVKCCQLARTKGAGSQVEIVSDGDFGELAKRLNEEGFKIQKDDSGHLSPPELLRKLASTSRHLVLSNSSLSWWAGALANGVNVYSPQTWFRNIETCDMHLSEWSQLESSWA